MALVVIIIQTLMVIILTHGIINPETILGSVETELMDNTAYSQTVLEWQKLTHGLETKIFIYIFSNFYKL